MSTESPSAQGLSERVCRVAIVGFGTVGRAVARILTDQPPPGVCLTHIVNRRISAKRVPWVPPDVQWTEDIEDVFASPVDILIELVGGLDPAGAWVRRALASGRSVVTANKQLIAHHGAELVALAQRQGGELRFEASVAGGIPILAALRDGLVADRITRVAGILNGTCNYILTGMEQRGVSFADALKEAQALGYAEADPTDDVDGYDARAKLSILCGAALRADVHPTQIATRPVTLVDDVDFRHAGQLGCTIRQISQAEWTDESHEVVYAAVRPSLVPRDSALARVAGSQNIVVLKGEYGGETVYSGFGAGGGPTSVAVVSDVAAIARHARRAAMYGAAAAQVAGVGEDEPHVTPIDEPAMAKPRVLGEFVTPHYLRFIVRDKPGIIAAMASAMERHGINIDAVLQLRAPSKDALPFVVTVEACTPAQLSAAIGDIASLDFNVHPPVDLPILSGSTA